MIRTLLCAGRSALFFLGLAAGTAALSMAFLLAGPLMGARRRDGFAAWWCRAVLGWLRLCCGVRCAVRGEVPAGPVVALANHQSAWETLFLYSALRPVSPILKRELLWVPLWGWALAMQAPVAIDRGRPGRAGRSVLTQGAARLRAGRSVLVFPEGTRSPPGEVRPFSRSGARLAAAAGAPVLPVAHNAGSVWPRRRFIKRPGVVTVEFGAPLAAAGRPAEEVTRLAREWIRSRVETG